MMDVSGIVAVLTGSRRTFFVPRDGLDGEIAAGLRRLARVGNREKVTKGIVELMLKADPGLVGTDIGGLVYGAWDAVVAASERVYRGLDGGRLSGDNRERARTNADGIRLVLPLFARFGISVSQVVCLAETFVARKLEWAPQEIEWWDEALFALTSTGMTGQDVHDIFQKLCGSSTLNAPTFEPVRNLVRAAAAAGFEGDDTARMFGIVVTDDIIGSNVLICRLLPVISCLAKTGLSPRDSRHVVARIMENAGVHRGETHAFLVDFYGGDGIPALPNGLINACLLDPRYATTWLADESFSSLEKAARGLRRRGFAGQAAGDILCCVAGMAGRRMPAAFERLPSVVAKMKPVDDQMQIPVIAAKCIAAI